MMIEQFTRPLCAGLTIVCVAASASLHADEAAKILTLHGVGAQVYECKAAADGAATWQFREPVATLFDKGKTVGRHFAGPSWELSDGSSVKGKVTSSTPGASVQDIPSLKLEPVGPHGAGALADVKMIERVKTQGGIFAGGCDRPGAFHAEPYAADYVFTK